MRAVVTGCAGFIGSHLAEKLLGLGWSVLGIDCFSPTYNTSRRRSLIGVMSNEFEFEFVEGNINDIDLRSHIEDADVVFHLAARPGVRASWTDFANASDANILATQRVLDALVDHPTTRVIFASSSSIYGATQEFPTTENSPVAPISPYGVTKAACEALVHAYVSQFDLNVVTLRYFTVFGPRQRSDMAFTKWIRAALRSESLPVYGDGSAVRDFTYVADVVDATIAAAICDTEGHEILNVAGGSPARVSEVLALLEELLGVAVNIDYLPRAAGDPDRTGGDTTRLKRLTGWQPAWELADGLRAQIGWLQSNGPGSRGARAAAPGASSNS